jgi:hypothetical protein
VLAVRGGVQPEIPRDFVGWAVSPVFWVDGTLEREPLTRGPTSEGRKRVPVVACEACGHVRLAEEPG